MLGHTCLPVTSHVEGWLKQRVVKGGKPLQDQFNNMLEWFFLKLAYFSTMEPPNLLLNQGATICSVYLLQPMKYPLGNEQNI